MMFSLLSWISERLEDTVQDIADDKKRLEKEKEERERRALAFTIALEEVVMHAC